MNRSKILDAAREDGGRVEALCWECANCTAMACGWVRSAGRVPVPGAQISWQELRPSGGAGKTLTGVVLSCPDFRNGEPELLEKSDEGYALLLEAIGKRWRADYAEHLREEDKRLRLAAREYTAHRPNVKRQRRALADLGEAVALCRTDEQEVSADAVRRIRQQVLAPVDID